MNDAEVSIKFNNKVTGEAKLEKYAEQLKIINSVLSGLDAGKMKQLQESASNVQILNADMGDIKEKASGAFDILKIAKYTRTIKRLGSAFSSLTKKSVDYLENFNLFQVAFNGNYKSAERFINKMTEMYSLDESWLTQTVGKFKQLTNAMQLTAETGEKVSELLTEMSLDISSLYNVDIDRAASTLSSAMAGQTKPIRGVTGGDITVPTLQTTLDQLDIDRTVNSLSYAEKRMLIIISLTKQLKASIGDMSRTLDSPANQLRIMHEQWERLTRAVGNVFLPILAKILPYLNAILMVLTEIISAIASLLGYKQDDFDYFDESAAGAWDLDAGMKSAAKSAKKLKQGLRGFDKLNNITSPATGTGGSGGGAGGIDKNILKEFNKTFDDYQKKFENVKNKANEIRDSIMEWLGFTKLVDDETDDVSFKFDHITGGTVLGALAVGGTIFIGISKIFGIFKKLGLLKFPLLTKLFGGGGTKEATDALGGAAGIGDVVKDKASSFKLPSIKTVLTGLAELAIVIGGLTVLMVAIGEFMRIPTVKEATTTGIKMVCEVFTGIGSIFIPLALVTAGMVGLGSLGGGGVANIAIGLGDVAIVIAGTVGLITAIGALMSISGVSEAATLGVETVVKVFNGISEILLPLGLLTVGLAAAGLAGGAGAGAIVIGLADLALIVGGTTGVVAAMGALSEKDFIKNNLDNGIELMVKLFTGLGRVVGAIAGGLISELLEQVGKSLPKFGEQLSQFATKAEPFFDKIKVVNEKVAKGVKYLADAMLELTAAQVLKGLTNWFSKKVPLSEFGEELESFGPAFKNFADSISSISKDTISKTETVAKATLVLIDMADQIPNEGGLLAKLIGDNTLGDFGKMLPDFGKNFTSYSKNVAGVDAGVVAKSTDIKDSMLQIIEFAKKIPNEGGVVAFFTGDNGIKKFGESLADFGKSFKEYYNSVSKVGLPTINAVTEAITSLVNNAKKIKDNGLGKTMKDFGEDLEDSAKDMNKFFKNVLTESSGKTAGKEFGKGIVKGIKNAINDGKIKLQLKDSSGNNAGGSYSFKATASYAKGGLPPVGQVFVANEKGPELVSHIGGQSFVANQNQVIDLMDKKLGDAKANPINATFVIQVGTREVAKEVISDLQDMAKTNGKPITIGG